MDDPFTVIKVLCLLCLFIHFFGFSFDVVLTEICVGWSECAHAVGEEGFRVAL